MKLEQKIEHECNRLVLPPGRFGHGDTAVNRINILNMLYRLELVDDFLFTRISKSIDLAHFENPEPIERMDITILEDIRVKRVIKIDFCLPERTILQEKVKQECDRLLLPIGSFGSGDNAFSRLILLHALYRMDLIEDFAFLNSNKTIAGMGFMRSENVPLFIKIKAETKVNNLFS